MISQSTIRNNWVVPTIWLISFIASEFGSPLPPPPPHSLNPLLKIIIRQAVSQEKATIQMYITVGGAGVAQW